MSALDLRGFVSEPTSFEGLDRLSNNLYNQKQQKIKQAKEQEAQQASSTEFVTNYLKDKDKYTGTNYDPLIHEGVSTAMNSAMGLIKKGANISDVVTAISPILNNVDTYSRNAQIYAQNKKGYIDRLKQGGAKGIDLEKLNSEIDNQAFPKGVDITQVDPNINYGDLALKNGDVYNTEGFDETFKNAPKNVEKGVVKNVNKKGGYEKYNVELTSPYYAQSEKDADGNHIGFVPKYQVAKDEGNDLVHNFETDKGNVNAPIRLFDKDLFDAMPPSEKGYIIQEARKYAKSKGIDIASPQVENLARAIAYDEKKARINGTYKHIEDTKENPIKIYNVTKPTQAEKKSAISQSDLHTALNQEPTSNDGKIDVSSYINGITFLTNSKGKRVSQPKVFFNPKDKTFSYTDEADAGMPEEVVSFEKFKSRATPSNPQSDLNFLEGFRTYKRTEKQEAPKQESGGLVNKAKKFAYRFIGGQAPEKKTETKPKATGAAPFDNL